MSGVNDTHLYMAVWHQLRWPYQSLHCKSTYWECPLLRCSWRDRQHTLPRKGEHIHLPHRLQEYRCDPHCQLCLGTSFAIAVWVEIKLVLRSFECLFQPMCIAFKPELAEEVLINYSGAVSSVIQFIDTECVASRIWHLTTTIYITFEYTNLYCVEKVTERHFALHTLWRPISSICLLKAPIHWTIKMLTNESKLSIN